MYATNELTPMVDELAGHWTDSTLEVLNGAGIRPISVDMELEIWHTFKKVAARRADLGVGCSCA